MKLHTLLSSLPFCQYDKGENPTITSIENDHRLVVSGSLFICVKGYTVDGHDFAQAAADLGAAAILAEKPVDATVPVILVNDTKRAMAVLADMFYGHPTRKLTLVGITGTNGKTTTSHLIEKLLNDQGKKTGLIGTMYTKIGSEIAETKNTTPDSVTLQKIFSRMVESGVDAAVMEVSSHALELGRVHRSDYDIAVFTNLTQDHLDFHGNMEEYAKAKALLFAQCDKGSVNYDDPYRDIMLQGAKCPMMSYSADFNEADLVAKDIKLLPDCVKFCAVTTGEIERVKLGIPGRFSVYNALGVISCGIQLGLSLA